MLKIYVENLPHKMLRMSEAGVLYIDINLRLKATVCAAISPHMLRVDLQYTG